MAAEKESSSEYKWLEYLLYAGALAFVLVAVYQLVSTHRIVLLERTTYAPTESDATPSEAEQTADDAGA